MSAPGAKLPSAPSLTRTHRAGGGCQIIGVKRGMVFWATIPVAHAVGAEQRHDFRSPWLVLSVPLVHERLPIVQVVPFTSKLDKGEGVYSAYRIRISERELTHYDVPKGLRAGDQLALTEQTRVMSHDRLSDEPIAMLSPAAIESVAAGVAYVLGL